MKGQIAKRGNGEGLRRNWPAPLGFRQELDDFFNRVLGGEGGWLSTDTLTPTMDLSETDDAYQVELDLPGVKSEEIDIQVNGNMLTVSGERKEEKEEKGRTYRRTERTVGTFSRTVTLPCEINEDNVSASLDGGVLTIGLPKAEEAKPRKIKVKA